MEECGELQGPVTDRIQHDGALYLDAGYPKLLTQCDLSYVTIQGYLQGIVLCQMKVYLHRMEHFTRGDNTRWPKGALGRPIAPTVRGSTITSKPWMA